MAVRIETTADGLTAAISGEIDHHTARVLRERIDTAIERTRPKRSVWISRESDLWTARESG